MKIFVNYVRKFKTSGKYTKINACFSLLYCILRPINIICRISLELGAGSQLVKAEASVQTLVQFLNVRFH
jgi:hypothetical protein